MFSGSTADDDYTNTQFEMTDAPFDSGGGGTWNWSSTSNTGSSSTYTGLQGFDGGITGVEAYLAPMDASGHPAAFAAGGTGTSH